jgi:uncharacterized protein (TIGR00299 family) protein
VRTAYLDCSSGISGDMTVAALVDAGVDFGMIRAGINSLGLPGVTLAIENVMRCGFRASRLRIEHPEQHAHRHYQDICRIIDRGAALTDRQRNLARRIFEAIGNAEARVHGSTLEKIHFHEVGAIDSIVDIVASAIGFDLLGVDEVVASPVPTGRGKVKIAHGICNVPTPGTAELLKGIPLVDVPVEFELTTPTGAAIVKSVATRFGPLPAMTIESIGYGAGTKDFPDRANVLRIVVGTTNSAAADDQVWLLETNLDDIPGETIGYTKQKLLAAGALDVYSTGIQMKKDRPGTLLSVICMLGDRERMETILFSETATFGIRRHLVERSKRIRREHFVETPWGRVQGKLGRFGGDVVFTPEHDSCASLASRFNVPLRKISEAAIEAYRGAPVGPDSVEAPPAEQLGLPADGACIEDDCGHDHSHDHHQ